MDFYVKRTKKIRRKKTRVFVALLFLFLLGVFLYFELVVNPVVVSAVRSQVVSLSSSAVSRAVNDVLCVEDISYDDLVKISYDESGKVSLLNLETVNLNKLARQFYQFSQGLIDKIGEKGVEIGLGAFTGIPFLSGVGPKIRIKMLSIGSMSAVFLSKFSSAGINQTCHSLFVKLFSTVSLVLPAYKSNIETVTEVLIAQSVVVGEIPQVFLGQNDLKSYVPT